MTARSLTADDVEHARRSVNLARQNRVQGGRPFGAVITLPDTEPFEARNAVVVTGDPTAHAELLVIRVALSVGVHDLSQATIYSSCEPCAMCAAAIRWAGIERVVHCLARESAAAVGFPDIADPRVSRQILCSVEVLVADALGHEAKAALAGYGPSAMG